MAGMAPPVPAETSAASCAQAVDSARAAFREALPGLASMLEEHLISNDRYLSSGVRAGRFHHDLHAHRLHVDLDHLTPGLRRLGFELDEACPWRQLGLAKLEGIPPELHAIVSQARLGRDILAVALVTPWGREGAAAIRIHAAQRRLEDAAAACEKDLLQVLAERRCWNVDRQAWGT